MIDTMIISSIKVNPRYKVFKVVLPSSPRND